MPAAKHLGMTVNYPFRKILVPTDFSSCSDSALELGAKMARDMGSALVALHVIDLGHVPAEAVIRTPAHPEGIMVRDHIVQLAEQELAHRIDRYGDGVSFRSSRVAFGAPVQAICDAARELGADLIVMGTHGRSGLAHIVMGSIAEKVLRVSKLPVLTVREEVCVDHPLDPGLDGEDMG